MHADASRSLYAETLWSGPLRYLFPSARECSELNRAERRRHVHGSEHVGKIVMDQERRREEKFDMCQNDRMMSMVFALPLFPIVSSSVRDLFDLASGERDED